MNAPSLYRQVMGAAFDALPPALRTFHSLQGRHVLEGRVRVDAPASAAARGLAWCIGSPLQAHEGPIRFELEAGPGEEVWTRHFPGKTMRSTLRRRGDEIVEQLGPARLSFTLTCDAGRLEMRHARLHVLGVPCPRWLAPGIVAQETATAGRLHFRVQARVPWVGVVASYQGHLEVAHEATP